MADFKISRFKYTWEGEWISGAQYNPDDVVSIGGKVYVCLVRHESSADFYDDLRFENTDTPPLPVPRWELMNDGIMWKGTWSPSTYYNIGDIVKVGPTVYLCIEKHTSGELQESFATDYRDEEGNELYWTIHSTSGGWRLPWTVGTLYRLGDVVSYSGSIYKCIEEHTSAGTIADGLVVDIEKWELTASSTAWQGDWQPDFNYEIGDIVKYGGIVYKCTAHHTSTDNEVDGLEFDPTVWDIVVSNVEYLGDWASSERYKANDIVKYGAYLYICIDYHVSDTDFDSAKWAIFCDGQQYESVWDSSSLYQPGDIVRHGGYLFASITTNVNQTPAIDSTNWRLLYFGTRVRGEFRSDISYKIGDLVRRNGQLYMAKQDCVGQDTDLPDDGSTINDDFWHIVIPGSKWQGFWKSGLTYTIGDVVNFRSASFRCIGIHIADTDNRPTGLYSTPYWEQYTYGDVNNVLTFLGDIKTFGIQEDGSSIGTAAISAGAQGTSLVVNQQSFPEWKNLNSTPNVYYVSTTGTDEDNTGLSLESAWRTVHYALEHVVAPATVFVKSGTYDEILPLRIPAYVAVVGDELRGTVIQPADNYFDANDVNAINTILDRLKSIMRYVVEGSPIGTTNIDELAYGTLKYTTDYNQKTSGSVGTLIESLFAIDRLNQIESRLAGTIPTILGSNDETTDEDMLAGLFQIDQNINFLKADCVGYLAENLPSYTASTNKINLIVGRILNAIKADMLYGGNYRAQEAGRYFYNGSNADANKSSDMFYMRDATGLRNMTLSGLYGELGNLNTNLTRRPSAGAFVSLDPSWGPGDNSAWVGTRSPYIQNVTNFGTGCVGLKVDGSLHGGGNQTIVCNDFTQILNDGIGVWVENKGKTECVSVFTYYNHIGYLATNGGKIRGTNGNASYGEYGAVAEGYDVDEDPITASVYNRYYDATVSSVLSIGGKISKLFYSHAGQEYTTASYTVAGSGINANLLGNEFRNGAITEVRLVDPGDSSAVGGAGYTYNQNNSQAGDTVSITLAGSDENTPDVYRTLRLYIASGTGTGQYGYIADYKDDEKIAFVASEFTDFLTVNETFSADNTLDVGNTDGLEIGQPVLFKALGNTEVALFGNVVNYTVYYVKEIISANLITISETDGGAEFVLSDDTGEMEMHLLGWNHVQPGTEIESLLDTTTSYRIEPRLTFSDPSSSSTNLTMPINEAWISTAYGLETFVAVATDSAVAAYNIDGSNWVVTSLPESAAWNKVAFGGGYFVAVSTDGKAARSADGIVWESVSIPDASYSSVAYGDDAWIAVSYGGTDAAISTDDGETWTQFSMPEGADWIDITYGKGKFVAISSGDSSSIDYAYSSDAGDTWTAGSIATAGKSITFGNDRFVIISGGYGGADKTAISFDGITWLTGSITPANWQSVAYGEGTFIAIAAGNNIVGRSNDGRKWTIETIGSNTSWSSVTFGAINNIGYFMAVAGGVSASTTGIQIRRGTRAEGRIILNSGRASSIVLWEPGSNYTDVPTLTITDPNNSTDASYTIRVVNGALGSPTFVNRGDGYASTSTRVTVSGDGYKEQFQVGSELIVSDLSRLPGPGDNLNISGINDYTYRVLSVTVLGGTAPTYLARLVVGKSLGNAESPDHGVGITIRQNYSQIRLTGHDFLDIGLGNFVQTNYPDTLNPSGTVLSPQNEIKIANGGRVFYTSTDQDGNYRVGELFAVEQASGTVTISAEFFQLEGLEELSLGGVTVGGTGVVIREFSTDPLFTADSNNIVPTQAAIKAYIQRRISGGGADAFTARLVAGVVTIGPDSIGSTTDETVTFNTKVSFKQPVDGEMLRWAFFRAGAGGLD